MLSFIARLYLCNKDTILGDFLYRAVEPTIGVDPGGDGGDISPPEFWQGGMLSKISPPDF